VRNEVLHGVKEEKITLHTTTKKEGCLDWSHLAWELSSKMEKIRWTDRVRNEV